MPFLCRASGFSEIKRKEIKENVIIVKAIQEEEEEEEEEEKKQRNASRVASRVTSYTRRLLLSINIIGAGITLKPVGNKSRSWRYDRGTFLCVRAVFIAIIHRLVYIGKD